MRTAAGPVAGTARDENIEKHFPENMVRDNSLFVILIDREKFTRDVIEVSSRLSVNDNPLT